MRRVPTKPSAARPLAALLGMALLGSAPAAWAQASGGPPGSSATPSTAAAAGDVRVGGFMDRLYHAYTDDLLGTAAPAAPTPDPPRRGLPSPYSSPPNPFTEYPGIVLGIPYSPTTGPLMAGLAGTGVGRALDDARISIYGWTSVTANASTSARSNAPLGYDIRPNRFELNQALLRIERLPDTAQTDHVDWGFRFDSLGGLDYRFSTAKGILSDQLLRHNNTYGYDPFVFYGEVYVPQVAEGMTVRFGRYFTFQDVESVTAPDKYSQTHTMLNTYDAYTQVGAIANIRINRNLTIDVGLNGGNDITPGVSGAKPTFTGCVRTTTDSNNDGNIACAVALNDGRYAYGNVQNMVSNTWSHRFSDRLHMENEVAYLWQRAVPGIGHASALGFANFLTLQTSERGRITLRNEVFDDPQGQRTGVRTIYTTHSLGYAYSIGPYVLRPELRFDHSYDARAYDRGTERNQFMALVNLITRF